MTRDIAVLVGMQLLWGFGFGVIAPIWPLALREIGASPQDVGVVFGVGNLAAVFAFLPAGYIADRVGRKPVIVAALAVGAIGAWSFVPLTDWHGAFIGAALLIVSLTLYPVYLHEVAGVLVERVGIFVALVSLGSTVLAIAMGRLADELGTVAALMTAAATLVSGAILT